MATKKTELLPVPASERFITLRSPHHPHATEWGEQATVIQWRDVQIPQRPYLFMLFHTPNGEMRERKTYRRKDGSMGSWSPSGTKIKMMGGSAGVPDLMFPVSRGRWRGLAIEMKVHDGKLSPDQRVWLKALKGESWLVAVCYGSGAAIELIDKYDALDD
jgi:hypothetical protein